MYRRYVVEIVTCLKFFELCVNVTGKVAPYKEIRGGVKFLKSIPKTSAGKNKRSALRMILSQGSI